MKALGMIETRGLVASIEAADAMVKAANVTPDVQGARGRRPGDRHGPGRRGRRQGGRRCRSSRSERVGELVSIHVIPRPHEELEGILSTPAPITPTPSPPAAGGQTVSRRGACGQPEADRAPEKSAPVKKETELERRN